uniref:Uncharacterized protein n=1 Tax=Oryza brachyantha TaxID=4533 RepID=J3LM32_ORYBR
MWVTLSSFQVKCQLLHDRVCNSAPMIRPLLVPDHHLLSTMRSEIPVRILPLDTFSARSCRFRGSVTSLLHHSWTKAILTCTY